VAHFDARCVHGHGVRQLLQQDVIRAKFQLLIVQKLVVVIEFLEGGVYGHQAQVARRDRRVQVVQDQFERVRAILIVEEHVIVGVLSVVVDVVSVVGVQGIPVVDVHWKQKWAAAVSADRTH
jgi:hypothetical protein